jgi:tagatose-6-phosphate ketose/aldose isomerase
MSDCCGKRNIYEDSDADEQSFLATLVGAQSQPRTLLGRPIEDQKARGYFHTLGEILQQPWTWSDTRARVTGRTADLKRAVADIRSLVLTGSGTSEYAGEFVRLVLQKEMGVTASVIGGGTLVTHLASAFPPARPALMISLARSGDSPESLAALSRALETAPEIRHLVITCNAEGTLAVKYREDPRVQVVVLDGRTNDRSLAMTSSLTNMVLAARYLGLLEAPEIYRSICERLSKACRELFLTGFDALARVAAKDFRRVVFLGSGSRWGACRESALKMLEMSGGRVGAMCETYLGLRHGPMSYIRKDTLMVSFLSSDPTLRAFELDLLEELQRKRLGMGKVIVGDSVPSALVQAGDTAIDLHGLRELGDENVPVIDVVVGQLLAFGCCLREGLQPDCPSEDGVINRVVGSFPIYGRQTEVSA